MWVVSIGSFLELAIDIYLSIFIHLYYFFLYLYRYLHKYIGSGHVKTRLQYFCLPYS